MQKNHATLMKGIKYRNYTIINELGRGSFGVVYKAVRNDGEIVAIKSILLSRYKEHGGLVGQLVENEKQALLKLKSLHVIKLIEYFEEDNQGLFILEYCDSGTLEDLWMKQNCKFSIGTALNYFKQILKGMKALHEQKIVHRDLKMANILVHGDVLKIADFGFCHMFKNYTSLTQLNLGTPGYKAPEVIEGKPYGLSSDMFAVGVILYQMIFETNPFNSFDDKIFLRETKSSNPPKFKLPGGQPIDPNIPQLLTQMLRYDPQQRLKWTELFSNRIFMGQSSCKLMNNLVMIMKEKTEYLAEIDPYASRLFYEKAEKANYFEQDQIVEENSKKNTIQDSLPVLVENKTIEDKNQRLNTQQIMNQHKEEYLVEKSLEEIQSTIINDYVKQKFPITWISITYNQMRTINHKQIFRSIFVSYVLMKQIYYEHLRLRESIKKNPKYNELMKNDIFKSFMKEFEEENELLHVHITIEFQTVQANSDKLNKYISPTWKKEIYSITQTSQFQQIFKESLQQYIQYIHQEYQNSLNQEILMYILRLLNCRDYENLCKKENISDEFRKIQIQSANELQKEVQQLLLF